MREFGSLPPSRDLRCSQRNVVKANMLTQMRKVGWQKDEDVPEEVIPTRSASILKEVSEIVHDTENAENKILEAD